MSWTDDRIELLKKLWGDGLSASQIAGRLGLVSRSAVIGKVHRLGLSGRASSKRVYQGPPKRKLPPKTSNLPGLPAKPKISPARAALAALGHIKPEAVDAYYEELVIPADERKFISTLEDGDCRWPIGDPQEPEFHFCGKAKVTVTSLPYCEFHARRAFQPPRLATGVNLARRPLRIVSEGEDGQKSETAAGGASERETEMA